MMKLADLEPRWIHEHVFAFRCPHCREVWLTCKRVVMGNKEQRELLDKEFGEDESHNVVGCRNDTAWSISGTMPQLTVTPSIDASASGHWHGHITNGECTP